MGWWSPMIMGGDPPAEWRGVLGNIAGADDPFNPLTAEMLDKNIGKIVERIEKDDDDPNIGWQVLGVMILRTGAKMPDKIRIKICKNIYDKEIDSWSEPDDRRFFFAHFMEQVENYKDGEKVKIANDDTLMVARENEVKEKMRKRVSVKELRKELGTLLKKYRTSSKVKKPEALRDILIDVIHICEKSKVDFYNTATSAMEIFKAVKK